MGFRRPASGGPADNGLLVSIDRPGNRGKQIIPGHSQRGLGFAEFIRIHGVKITAFNEINQSRSFPKVIGGRAARALGHVFSVVALGRGQLTKALTITLSS